MRKIFKPLILSAMVLATVSCGKNDENVQPEDSNIQQYVTVTRAADDGAKASATYEMTFSKEGTWTIYQGDSPSTIDMSVSVGHTSESTITLDGFSSDQRYYFNVVLNGSQISMVSETQLPFKGQVNCRDLGGIITADGHKVKWGMVYRSGDLSLLSATDQAYFKNLGVKNVVDFRSEDEVAQAPDKLPDGVAYYNMAIDNSLVSRDQILAWLRAGDADALDTVLYQVYKSFVLEYSDQFSLFLNRLQEGDGPLLFHCSQGKDRAGWATALFLAALGVDDQTIMENYMASNEYLNNVIEKTIQMVNLAGMDGEILRPVLVVKEDYLKAAIDLVENEFGDLQTYVKDQLGVDVERLKKLYLE